MNIENILEIEENDTEAQYSKVSVRLDEKYTVMLSTLAKVSNKPINRYLTDYISKKIVEWMIQGNQEQLKIVLEKINSKYEDQTYGRKNFLMSRSSIDSCKYSEILDSPIADLSMQWEKDTQNSFIRELKDKFEFQYKPEILLYAERKAEELPSITDI